MKTPMKHILLGLFIAASGSALAQQDPQSSMYMFNPLAVNPAYAGSAEGLQSNILYRSQWTAMPGAPKTFTANIHNPFFDEKVGGGISFSSDELGVTKRSQVALAGSYHLQFKTFRVSMGLSLSLSQYHVGLSSVQHSIDGSVDNAFSADINENTFNFGTGIFGYAKNWYVGLSVPHFKRNILSVNTAALDLTAFETPHMFFQGGYIYDINPMWSIKPNFMMKYVNHAPLSFDLNCNVYYKKTIGAGLGFRTDKSMIALFEVQLHPFLKVGYAYDYSLSSLATYAASSHEFFLRYAIGPKGVHISPRLY